MEIVLLMSIMVCCGVAQSFFCKLFTDSYEGDNQYSSVVFTAVFGLVIGFITWFVGGCQMGASSYTWIIGLITACFLFLYNTALVKASQLGSYSLLMISLLFGGIIIPSLSGSLFFDEKITSIQMCAIILMLISFVVMNYKGISFKAVPKIYYVWCGALFLSNGLFGSLMNAQQMLMEAKEREEMIAVTYLSCAIMAVIYHYIIRKKKMIKDYHMGRKAALFAIISCLSAAVAVNLIMYLITKLASTIVFTIGNGAVLSLSVICSCIFLKERLSKNQIVGICLSVIGIMLFSI